MFPDNDWYGHKKILFEYCGIKKLFPIYGILQHGWYPFTQNNVGKSSIFPDAPYFSWKKNPKNFFKYPDTINECIGAPFLYLHKIQSKKTKLNGKGTLVFPAHSNPETIQDVFHEKLIKIVKKKYKGPYKVVLFFTDYKKKNISIYKKNGFKVFCFGNRGNINFLKNAYKTIASSKTVISTELSTPIIYSMYLKKKCILIDRDENSKPLNMTSTKDTEAFRKTNFYKKISKGKLSIKDQFKYSQIELGENSIKSPNELRKILQIDSFYLSIKSFIFAKMYDFKYGSKARYYGLPKYPTDEINDMILDQKTSRFKLKK